MWCNEWWRSRRPMFWRVARWNAGSPWIYALSAHGIIWLVIEQPSHCQCVLRLRTLLSVDDLSSAQQSEFCRRALQDRGRNATMNISRAGVLSHSLAAQEAHRRHLLGCILSWFEACTTQRDESMHSTIKAILNGQAFLERTIRNVMQNLRRMSHLIREEEEISRNLLRDTVNYKALRLLVGTDYAWVGSSRCVGRAYTWRRRYRGRGLCLCCHY